MTTLKIDKPDAIFFFCGAVAWLPDAIKIATSMNINCHVFAATRHLNELFDNTSLSFKETLEKNNFSYVHCDDINSSIELKKLVTSNSIGIGIGEAYTFNSETLGLFNRNVFDFMTIRMPKYRGGAHFTWQILQQNRIGAWCVQLINEAMIPAVYDDAPVIKTHEYVLPASARTPSDYFKAADQEGLKLFKSFISDIFNEQEFNQTILQENLSLYFPRLYTLKHGFINWAWNGNEIEQFILAFDEPYVGASTFCNGERYFLKSCHLEKGEGMFHPFMSGLIYRIYNKRLFIAVKDGTIIVENINNTEGSDAINEMKVGMRFHTPIQYLEEAMLFNAEFNTVGLKN